MSSPCSAQRSSRNMSTLPKLLHTSPAHHIIHDVIETSRKLNKTFHTRASTGSKSTSPVHNIPKSQLEINALRMHRHDGNGLGESVLVHGRSILARIAAAFHRHPVLRQYRLEGRHREWQRNGCRGGHHGGFHGGAVDRGDGAFRARLLRNQRVDGRALVHGNGSIGLGRHGTDLRRKQRGCRIGNGLGVRNGIDEATGHHLVHFPRDGGEGVFDALHEIRTGFVGIFVEGGCFEGRFGEGFHAGDDGVLVHKGLEEIVHEGRVVAGCGGGGGQWRQRYRRGQIRKWRLHRISEQ
mmetsp:Transcript_22268/g.33875  ORF Transcript_22268/g.33875 Transcript_22268/m.33875 type:complete len:295 (+) Transcript_22268:230-1114(+)